MFFSPGFAPLLFRNNRTITFNKYRDIEFRQQDGDVGTAFTSVGWGLSIDHQKPSDRKGYLLPEPDNRSVNGLPIVGMLGRDILPDGAVVNLDLPGRRVTISAPPVNCPTFSRPLLAHSIDMQQEILLVPIKINGTLVDAVLEPDLPVSILPREVARKTGISDADLENDPSVVTKFGRGVLGRRHQVNTLDVGDVQLQKFAFDVEDNVTNAMLGANFFDFGQGIFDFQNQKFLFKQTTRILPAPTNMHFDQTKVVYIRIDE